MTSCKQVIFGGFFLIYIFWSGRLYGAESKPWTWMFKTFFTSEDRISNDSKKEIGFVANDTPQFTQCIVSWNAERPKQGYFSFFVQVRDSSSKKWHVWHKMYDWGAGIQRSHLTKSTVGTSYHYVRLEVPVQMPADGIKIRIEAFEGAHLSGIHALFTSASRLDAFKAEEASPYATLSSKYIKGVPLISQRILEHPKKDVLCSPTSLSMVMSYLLKQKIDPCHFANAVYDAGLNAYGSWPFNTAHAYEIAQSHCPYCFYVRRLPSFMTLYQLLSKNIPVVVSVRGCLPGALKEYSQGHLLVIVGWDKKTQSVICHDPAFYSNEEVLVRYPLKSFLVAWERSRRLAYVAEPVTHAL